MDRRVSGKITTSQFRRTQKNGDVYERTFQYNPEKGYTEQTACRLLGKIHAGGTNMKPIRPGCRSGSTATRKTIGAMDILEWAGRESGIDDDLMASIGKDAFVQQGYFSARASHGCHRGHPWQWTQRQSRPIQRT